MFKSTLWGTIMDQAGIEEGNELLLGVVADPKAPLRHATVTATGLSDQGNFSQRLTAGLVSGDLTIIKKFGTRNDFLEYLTGEEEEENYDAKIANFLTEVQLPMYRDFLEAVVDVFEDVAKPVESYKAKLAKPKDEDYDEEFYGDDDDYYDDDEPTEVPIYHSQYRPQESEDNKTDTKELEDKLKSINDLFEFIINRDKK